MLMKQKMKIKQESIIDRGLLSVLLLISNETKKKNIGVLSRHEPLAIAVVRSYSVE